ncbi:transmembrane 26-like protein [Labeo rohita]|uniref:Transmembrane 26-like protein n=1 Tax=Labeo rohita TaxID=84645 RepID=A0A498NMY8_LABRO|nr:transmembrane 26-like protein [Labeo rohita]RXN32897.1 transmembrane 26-like protein [Labeo rohita]
MSDYEDLFRTDSVGKLPVMYHICLDESVHSTVCAPRRIPLAMKDKVLQELERMNRQGIISPVEEATPWVSTMAATVKKDGTVRICIDPVHLNKALLKPHHPLKTVEQVIADMPQAKVIFQHFGCKMRILADPSGQGIIKTHNFYDPVRKVQVSTVIWDFNWK